MVKWVLYKEEVFSAIQRDTYYVEAETLNEAVEKVKNDEVDPISYGIMEPLYDNVESTIIYDENNMKLWSDDSE